MKPTRATLFCMAMLALAATPAPAQYVVSAKSGMVNFTEGQVDLNGQPVESSLTQYPDIKEGSVLSTQEGRAEVLLTPGVTLRLGEHASLKMITKRLIDTRLELLAGSAVVEADQIAKDTNVTVVVNGAAVSLPKAGIYRFDAAPARVKVYSGEAAVLGGAETTLVGSGRAGTLNGGTVTAEKFNVDDTDALDHWSHRRGELMAMANVSAASSFHSSNYGYWSPFYMSGITSMGCAGIWGYNLWYGMYTYVPCSGMAFSPYGYGFWSPATVQNAYYSPTGTPVVHKTFGTGRGPVSSPGHAPLALAVNGSHAPGTGAAMRAAMSFGTARSGFSGFSSGGFVGAASRGGFSGGAAAGGGFSAGASYGGGGAASGGAVSAPASGGMSGGGGASRK